MLIFYHFCEKYQPCAIINNEVKYVI